MKLQIAILLALIYACTLNAQLTVTGRIIVKNNTDSIHEMTIKNMMMKNTSYTPVMGHRTKRFFQWSGKMGERF